MMEQNPKRTGKPDRPFYEIPENVPTSAKIIQEARQSIRSIREIKTNRPFTPRDERRTLFGSASSRNPENRPPSAFSLGSRHFDGSDSRPVSGTKLSPLDHTPSYTTVLEEQTPKVPTENEIEVLLPPKPPSDPNKSQRKVTRGRLIHSSSVDNSLASTDLSSKSGSLTDLSAKYIDGVNTETGHRTHSGPKERTPIPVEERGEGDGKEAPHRAPSVASVRSPPRSASSRDSESRVGSGGTKRTSSAGSTGRGGSAGKRDVEESPEEAQFYSSHIAPCLQEMVACGKRRQGDKLADSADSLYQILKKENLLGKNCKQRSAILKSIFKLLDVDEPRVLLRLARLILALKVSGNNLLNVCKLVFKVSRNEKNDPEFLRGNILDLLLETLRSTDHTTSTEALIYCIGAIKFLTGNSTIVKQLVKKSCIEDLGQLMLAINKTNRDNGKVNEQFGHVLVQLTAALRNLADTNSSRERFISCRVVESLCLIVDTYPGDGDLMLNISRIFSKITLHTDCCQSLADQPTSYRSFINLLNKHLKNSDIIVRVCFILGNITAKNDDARVRLFQESKSFDVLLSVLKIYLELDVKSKDDPKEEAENGRKNNKHEEVMIKVIRVIANLSINENVGTHIASNHQCADLLLSILEYKTVSTSEELVLNTVATVNNLSYYNVKTSAITSQQMRVIDALLKLVLADNMEAMVEASRVFGNLTRQRSVRDYLVQHKVDQMMITMLDSGNREVVYISCGVLINFMVDEEKRQVLKKEGGVGKLIEVLRDFGRTDWELSSLVCQILWNYSGRITSTNACFGEQQAQELMDLLIEYTDRDSAMEPGETDEDMKNYYLETWSEFCPIAEQLLQRVESFQSNFEPLENPSGS